MDEITLLRHGASWEICINGHPSNVLIDDAERAAVVEIREEILVSYFMKTLDGERWRRFKLAHDRFKK